MTNAFITNRYSPKSARCRNRRREKKWRSTEAGMRLGIDNKSESKNLDCEYGCEKVRKSQMNPVFMTLGVIRRSEKELNLFVRYPIRRIGPIGWIGRIGLGRVFFHNSLIRTCSAKDAQ